MKYFLCFFLIISVVSMTTGRQRSRISPRLRNIVCKRCFGKMYKHCAARIRLSKRSVDESMPGTEDVDNLHLRRPRRGVRKVRIRLTSCNVCRDICYKRRL